MSLLSSIAKWKMRWALVSSAFTFIVLPIMRLLFKRRAASKAAKNSGDAVDVKAEEIK